MMQDLILYVIFECIAVVFETFIVYQYISGLFEKKQETKSTLVWYSLFCIGLMALSLFYRTSFLLTVYTLIGIYCLLFFLYKTRPDSRFFSVFFFSVIVIISEILCSGMVAGLWGINSSDALSYGLPRVLIIIVAKLIQIFSVKILVFIAKRKGNYIAKIEVRMILPLLLCQVVSILLSYYIFIICHNVYGKFSLIAMLSLVGIIYMNAIIFWYFDRIKAAYEYKSRNEAAELKNELQTNYQNLLEQHQKETDALWHDMKKHINLMKSLINSGQSVITSEYVQELEALMGDTVKIIRTEYSILSALLTEQMQRAKKDQIVFDIEVKLESELRMTAVELCIVLGNLFDNAFEAVLHLPPDVNKKIKVSILQRNGAMAISLENPFDPKAKPRKRTRKHGLGLKNVRQVVDKHNGQMKIEDKNNIYKVSIIIP